jgi:hypothetical protein
MVLRKNNKKMNMKNTKIARYIRAYVEKFRAKDPDDKVFDGFPFAALIATILNTLVLWMYAPVSMSLLACLFIGYLLGAGSQAILPLFIIFLEDVAPGPKWWYNIFGMSPLLTAEILLMCLLGVGFLIDPPAGYSVTVLLLTYNITSHVIIMICLTKYLPFSKHHKSYQTPQQQ